MAWLPYASAAVSAVLLWLAFPPVGWGPLAVVALAPLLWGLRRLETAGAAFRVGFLFGFLFFGILLEWIFLLGAVAWFPLTIVLALYAGLYGILVWAVRLWPAWRWWLAAIGGWALMEWIRARFPFGGFPWGSVGYAAVEAPGAIGSAQWIGGTGWSVLAVAVSAGIALVVDDARDWRFVVDPAVAALLLAIAGTFLAPSADGDPIRVAIVQGNSPCPGTHCQNENRRIFESHLALTRSLAPETVGLVVWPENSTGTPFEPRSNPEVEAAITAQAERLGAYMLISGTRVESDEEFSNVNVVYAPSGRRVGIYEKQHPVPFGEYVPLRNLLGFIPQLDQVPRDMVRGNEHVAFRLPGGRLGSVISFEGAFARETRGAVRDGAELLVVATNESSYGRSPASDQLIAMTRVAAAANGVDVVHAAITGKSTIISAAGDVGTRTELFTAEALVGTVRFRSAGPTLYTRFGDWVQIAAILLMILAVTLPGEERVTGRRGAAGHGDPPRLR